MTVVKLDSMNMEKGILTVSGVDAFDNTPVLDIKPYLPALDCIDATIETGTVPEELRTRQ
jgi:tRNA (Thr-GGU) A37 N-methylase